MRSTLRSPLLFLGALAVLVALSAPATAEKPLSSPAVLEKTATHVVRGRIARIFERTQRQGGYARTEFVAEVHPTAVEKGEGIAFDRPLYARYWTQRWKGPGDPPPGTTGHAPVAEEGRYARLYLAQNAYDGFGTETRDGGFDVVGKNGIAFLTAEEAAPEAAGPRASPSFPAAWAGVWKGDLAIAGPGRPAASVPMVITIAETDDPLRWDLTLRYGDQPPRPYQIVVRDAEAGRYAIDERNGIVLPATFLDGELLTSFSLGGSLLTARYRLEADTLRYDLVQTTREREATTGGAGVPEVGVHEVQAVQRAILRR